MNRLKQRADYTHKRNAKSGRHRWLRLTPAYSLKVVEEILSSYDDASRIHVLNPFCGTGTMALCAAYHGHSRGAQLHYIVGNPTFYSIFVPVEGYTQRCCAGSDFPTSNTFRSESGTPRRSFSNSTSEPAGSSRAMMQEKAFLLFALLPPYDLSTPSDRLRDRRLTTPQDQRHFHPSVR